LGFVESVPSSSASQSTSIGFKSKGSIHSSVSTSAAAKIVEVLVTAVSVSAARVGTDHNVETAAVRAVVGRKAFVQRGLLVHAQVASQSATGAFGSVASALLESSVASFLHGGEFISAVATKGGSAHFINAQVGSVAISGNEAGRIGGDVSNSDANIVRANQEISARNGEAAVLTEGGFSCTNSLVAVCIVSASECRASVSDCGTAASIVHASSSKALSGRETVIAECEVLSHAITFEASAGSIACKIFAAFACFLVDFGAVGGWHIHAVTVLGAVLAGGARVASVCCFASSAFRENGDGFHVHALVVAAFADHAVSSGIASASVARAGECENLGDCKSKDDREDNSLHG